VGSSGSGTTGTSGQSKTPDEQKRNIEICRVESPPTVNNWRPMPTTFAVCPQLTNMKRKINNFLTLVAYLLIALFMAWGAFMFMVEFVKVFGKIL